MGRDLIDPMNEDTYDDRVIVSTTKIRSMIPTNAYRKGWDKAFGKKLKGIIKRRVINWFNRIKI